MLKPLFLGLAMTTLVVACTEDYTDWASPQTHAQGESKSITATIDSVKAIDMNGLDVQGPNPTVTVLKSTVTGAPRSAFSYQITLTPAEGLSGDQKATVLTADSLGNVSLEELLIAVRSYYGKAPRQRKLNASVVALANINDESYRFDGETAVRFTLTAPNYSEYMGVRVKGVAVANLSTIDFDGFYQGFARISSPFRLTYNYRNEIVDLGANSFALLDGDFDADAQQNIVAPAAGLYYLRADLKDATKQTLAPVAISKVGMIGGFNSWGGDTELTYNAAEGCYQAEVKFQSAGEFKFRFNGGWDINLGGSLNNLTFGGANLKADAGTYVVRLYLEQLNGRGIYATLTAK